MRLICFIFCSVNTTSSSSNGHYSESVLLYPSTPGLSTSGEVSHSSQAATLPTPPSKFGRSAGYWRRGKWSRYRCRRSLIAWSLAHQSSYSLYIQPFNHCSQIYKSPTSLSILYRCLNSAILRFLK